MSQNLTVNTTPIAAVTENVLDKLDTFEHALDQIFLIIMGIFVMMMQTGFAFLEAGSVRSKNATNLLIKNMLDAFVAGIAYWTVGFAFAFGEGNGFIGWNNFALSDTPGDKYSFFFFQYVFAATAATIVSGALAERCEMIAYFVYSLAITAFVYPVVTHWAWSSNGWLKIGQEYVFGDTKQFIGYQDFAGSGVVHCVGGSAALVGAILLGPRFGRFHKESKTPLQVRGHSIPFIALGGFILCFGFLAFNGGSQLTISQPGDGRVISLAVVNTVISGSTAAIVSLAIRRAGIFGGTWSLMYTLNGALAGMVAACAGCNSMMTWGAIVVGAIAGISFNVTSWWVCKAGIDDPVDAVAVHIGGGIWGVIAVAFLDYDKGILLHGDRRSGLLLAWQLVGACSIIAWTGLLCLLIFGVLRLIGIFRVPFEQEWNGLDIPKHGEPAYPVESYGHGHEEVIHYVNPHGQLSKSNLRSVFAGGFPESQSGFVPRDSADLNGQGYLPTVSPDGRVASNNYGSKSTSLGQANPGFYIEIERTAL